ncbi:MAG: hypothetical protein ACI4MT_04885 [Christensenellales bacterium]
MKLNELEKVEIIVDDAFSCCQDRDKIKAESSPKLHKFLRGVLTLNSEWNEEHKEALQREKDEEEAAQRRFLRSQSRNEIFGGGMRAIAGGFGASAVIVSPVKEKSIPIDDGLSDEERAVQYKREFNSLHHKAWYDDLSVSGIIDSNRFKNNVENITKAYYPSMTIATGGEDIDELSSVPGDGLGIEDKLDKLFSRLMAEDFGKPKKVKPIKKSPKPLNVKYTKPSGKPFVAKEIDESQIWGTSLDFKGRALPSAFESEKLNIQSFVQHNETGKGTETKSVERSVKPIKPRRPQKFKYTKPSGKPFTPMDIDESQIWGTSLVGGSFNMPNTFSEFKAEIAVPIKGEVLNGELQPQKNEAAAEKTNEKPQKTKSEKPKRLDKVDLHSEEYSENTENKKEEKSVDANALKGKVKPINNANTLKDKDKPINEKTDTAAQASDALTKKDIDVKQEAELQTENKVKDEKTDSPTKRKATKAKKKSKRRTAEIIRLSHEEAARRYTLPKGKNVNFDIDESAIWGGQFIRKEYNINSVLSGTFKRESITEQNESKSDNGGSIGLNGEKDKR